MVLCMFQSLLELSLNVTPRLFKLSLRHNAPNSHQRPADEARPCVPSPVISFGPRGTKTERKRNGPGSGRDGEEFSEQRCLEGALLVEQPWGDKKGSEGLHASTLATPSSFEPWVADVRGVENLHEQLQLARDFLYSNFRAKWAYADSFRGKDTLHHH